MYYFNLLDLVAKIRHTNINYTKIFEREYFPIYGIWVTCMNMYTMNCILCNLLHIFFPIRYFVLSNNGLTYSKTRSDGVIHTIPIGDMQAVERVDELAFNMKFVSTMDYIVHNENTCICTVHVCTSCINP